MKLIEKLQNYIKRIKTTLYTLPLAGSFKGKIENGIKYESNEKYITKYGHLDWYEINVITKIKIMIRQSLINVWRKIGNKILFEFYTEIYIENRMKMLDFSFPIVISAENLESAKEIIRIIENDLKNDYGFYRVNSYIPQLITNKEFIDNKIRTFYLGVNNNLVGEIRFDIYNVKKFEIMNITQITDDKTLIDEFGTYTHIDTQTVNYKLIKQYNGYLPLETYTMKINVVSPDTPTPHLTFEEQINRIKYLNDFQLD